MAVIDAELNTGPAAPRGTGPSARWVAKGSRAVNAPPRSNFWIEGPSRRHR